MESNNNFNENNQESNAPSLWECLLRLPADEATRELIKKGIQTIKDIKQSAQVTFNTIADEEYEKICVPLVKMDDCITWVKTQKQTYLEGQYLFIYVEHNEKPRNENDVLSVTIALLDAYKKPIPINKQKRSIFSIGEKNKSVNQDIVCFVIPSKTIDTKLTKTLNGTPSVLIKLW